MFLSIEKSFGTRYNEIYKYQHVFSLSKPFFVTHKMTVKKLLRVKGVLNE